jgi:hypothetical protein
MNNHLSKNIMVFCSNDDLVWICNHSAIKEVPKNIVISFYTLEDEGKFIRIVDYDKIVVVGFLGVALLVRALGYDFPLNHQISLHQFKEEAFHEMASWYGFEEKIKLPKRKPDDYVFRVREDKSGMAFIGRIPPMSNMGEGEDNKQTEETEKE